MEVNSLSRSARPAELNSACFEFLDFDLVSGQINRLWRGFADNNKVPSLMLES